MESKKKLNAAIVAAGIVVALLVGVAAGIAYQKDQPVNIQVTSHTDDGGDRVYDVQTYPATESVAHIYGGSSSGFSTTSRVIKNNDTSSYIVELKN